MNPQPFKPSEVSVFYHYLRTFYQEAIKSLPQDQKGFLMVVLGQAGAYAMEKIREEGVNDASQDRT